MKKKRRRNGSKLGYSSGMTIVVTNLIRTGFFFFSIKHVGCKEPWEESVEWYCLV